MTDTDISTDRRAAQVAVPRERRGRERRKGGRINRVAPRASRLQYFGALLTVVSICGLTLMGMAVVALDLALPWPAVQVLVAALLLSLLTLMLGSIEQRLIEIRLELLMLNGGQRRSDPPTAKGLPS